MGLDVYSRLVAGVHLDKVYSEKQQSKLITRYREDTGQSYEKTVHTIIHKLGNKEYTDEQWDNIESTLDDLDLELFTTSCEKDPAVIGALIAATDSNRTGRKQVVEVTVLEINTTLQRVRDILEAHFGISPDKVTTYLIPYYSY